MMGTFVGEAKAMGKHVNFTNVTLPAPPTVGLYHMQLNGNLSKDLCTAAFFLDPSPNNIK